MTMPKILDLRARAEAFLQFGTTLDKKRIFPTESLVGLGFPCQGRKKTHDWSRRWGTHVVE